MNQEEKLIQVLGQARGMSGVRSVEHVPVTCFDTYFGQWAKEGQNVIVHLFPRDGEKDHYYSSGYRQDDGAYVPGRLEEKREGVSFPPEMENWIKQAAGEVTLGDVELDFVEELGAWALRFRDVLQSETWAEPGGQLETFFRQIDALLDTN